MDPRFSKVDQVKIAQNSRMLFKPVHSSRFCQEYKAINSLCLRLAGVEVAFLSRCKLPTEEMARNVIVLGVCESQCIPTVATKLLNSLDGVEFEGQPIDVLPMRVSSIPAAVYQTGLRIA